MSHLGLAARTSRPAAAGRRSREQGRRVKRVEFTLTAKEFAELETAAGLAGLSRGVYAAQAAWPPYVAAQFCVRVIRRLDEAAEHVLRNVP